MTDKLLISAILILYVILALIFGLNWYLSVKPSVTEVEAQMILSQLKAKRAGNCVVVRTDYGFRAENLETGEIYKVMK